MTRSKHDVFKFINMHNGDKDVCWEWKGYLTGKGRPSFGLNGSKVTPYRLTYELLHGVEVPKGVPMLHSCDNPICCNPYHVAPGTHQKNMDEMKERERHGLPHHVVRAIRKLRAAGRSQKEVSELYGVDISTISRIDRGASYSHVADETDEEQD